MQGLQVLIGLVALGIWHRASDLVYGLTDHRILVLRDGRVDLLGPRNEVIEALKRRTLHSVPSSSGPRPAIISVNVAGKATNRRKEFAARMAEALSMFMFTSFARKAMSPYSVLKYE